MADLDSLHASGSVKIAGSDSSGQETTYVNSTPNGEIKASDILAVNVAQGTLTLAFGGAAQEVRAGANPLANRKSVLIQAQGSNIFYGFSAGSQPFTLANGSSVSLDLGPNIRVYVSRQGIGLGTVPVAFAEFA